MIVINETFLSNQAVKYRLMLIIASIIDVALHNTIYFI